MKKCQSLEKIEIVLAHILENVDCVVYFHIMSKNNRNQCYFCYTAANISGQGKLKLKDNDHSALILKNLSQCHISIYTAYRQSTTSVSSNKRSSKNPAYV